MDKMQARVFEIIGFLIIVWDIFLPAGYSLQTVVLLVLILIAVCESGRKDNRDE